MRTPAVTAPGLSAVVALAVLVALSCGLWPGARAADDAAGGPVIANAGAWNGLPMAELRGEVALAGGCLLLGGDVVFWPDGASWDAERQAVEVDGAAVAVVGESFRGGGGHFSLEQVRGLDGIDADAIARCLQETGAPGVVFAYPAG